MQQYNFRIARNCGFSGQGITDITAARTAMRYSPTFLDTSRIPRLILGGQKKQGV
jgi:hypothetical protein